MVIARSWDAAVEAELSAQFGRADLQAIGLILVRPGAPQETATLWCAPDVDPGPLYLQAGTEGRAVGALVLVFPGQATAYLGHPAWQGVEWFTAYLERLTGELARHGLTTFLNAVAAQGRLGQTTASETLGSWPRSTQ